MPFRGEIDWKQSFDIHIYIQVFNWWVGGLIFHVLFLKLVLKKMMNNNCFIIDLF